LTALRADQLLAASLSNRFADVQDIVAEPASGGVPSHRFVAVSPAAAAGYVTPAEASLVVVRIKDKLEVAPVSALSALPADSQVVGFFSAMATGTVVARTDGVSRRMDGPGTGSGSWIGYTAGGNVASGTNSAVAAGFNNQATALGAFVAAGQNHVASGVSSLVIGGFQNTAAGLDAMVGGGAFNRANGPRSVVLSGYGNLTTGSYGIVVGGGRDTNTTNPAGSEVQDNAAYGKWSFVGGGHGNRAGVSGNEGIRNSAVVGGQRNVASGIQSFIGAGGCNVASGTSAAVAAGGQESNTDACTAGNVASGSSAFIGAGSQNNTNNSASVIVGGTLNVIANTTSNGAFIGAGRGNQITGDRAAIVGGGSDSLGCFNRATGLFDLTCANRAEGRRNFIGAGIANRTALEESTIAGGVSNEATGPWSVVVGGVANTASGDRSFVGGGGSTSINTCFNRVSGLNNGPCQNVASGETAVIVGGIAHLASGRQSFIGGGSGNHATAERATVGGGVVNTASGLGATVPGGRANSATGAWSFAAGRGAATNDGASTPTHHFGAFVWSDTPDDGSGGSPAATQLFRSTAANQFAVRARGGVSFKVGNVAIAADAGDATPGCSLPAGGAASWSCSSDRNLKEAIRAISPLDVLGKVLALPLSTWQFKGSSQRHLSPMAQDFWAAFGLGEDDRHVSSSDLSGVALAAVQGLDSKLAGAMGTLAAAAEAKDAVIAAQQDKISSLERANAAMLRELAAIKRKLGM
jgi:hypothetical protein